MLTPREKEVIECLSKGYSNKQIAKELFITEKTVTGHMSNILSKLGVKSRSQVLIEAVKLGLVKIK